jgi:hypothetical protein
MNDLVNLLIVDDIPELRRHLILIAKSITTKWNILEVETYEEFIELASTIEVNVLICDLFLSTSESDFIKKNHIPEGMEVARIAKSIHPSIYTIAVSSNLDSFLRNNQILDYIDAGVDVFFDRSATPYEKFSEPLKYQLSRFHQLVGFSKRTLELSTLFTSHDLASSIWRNQETISCFSYWILIGNPDDSISRELIKELFGWEKTLGIPDASALLLQLHDSRILKLIERKIIEGVDDYPTLLIGGSPEMIDTIKVHSMTLDIIHKNSLFAKFLSLVHIQLRSQSISEIKKKMKNSNYWNWLNVDGIISFSYETGVITLRQNTPSTNQSIYLESKLMTSNKIIRIFLASSAELEDDRREFEIFINRQNKTYIEQNIFLRLEIWEDFIDAMSSTRLQDEYNKAVQDSNIFISLFHTKVGQYTEEEFTKALESMQNKDRPLIYTYFKDALVKPSQVNTNTLSTFKEKLKKLGHFPTYYNNIDDLQNQFSNQLSKLFSSGKI